MLVTGRIAGAAASVAMWVQTLVLFATAFAATSAAPSGASTVADRLYIFNNNSYCGGDKWTCVNNPLGVSLHDLNTLFTRAR
jgi:hypothetical protein